MKKNLLAFAAIAALSFAASATQPGNNGGGHGGCGVGQKTNGCQQPGSGGTGIGGAGGAGGSGGSAAALSASRADARARAEAVAQQRQSTRTSVRNNVPVSVSVSLPAASADQPAKQQAAAEKADQLLVAPAQERNPVSTAYAAPLTATNGTCMGSTSAGGQGAAFGLSIGTTWTDANCDVRYDAIALREAGLGDAAKFRLCQKADMRSAIEAAGGSCEPVKRKAAAAPAAAVARAPADEAPAAVVTYQDPIIRARLGLPPL